MTIHGRRLSPMAMMVLRTTDPEGYARLFREDIVLGLAFVAMALAIRRMHGQPPPSEEDGEKMVATIEAERRARGL